MSARGVAGARDGLQSISGSLASYRRRTKRKAEIAGSAGTSSSGSSGTSSNARATKTANVTGPIRTSQTNTAAPKAREEATTQSTGTGNKTRNSSASNHVTSNPSGMIAK